MITSPVHIDNSLNPAWRPAVLHVISERSWAGNTPQTEINAATHSMTHENGYALRQLAPDSGAYINEVSIIFGPQRVHWRMVMVADSLCFEVR